MGILKWLVRRDFLDVFKFRVLLKNIYLVGNMFLIVYCVLYSIEDIRE